MSQYSADDPQLGAATEHMCYVEVLELALGEVEPESPYLTEFVFKAKVFSNGQVKAFRNSSRFGR